MSQTILNKLLAALPADPERSLDVTIAAFNSAHDARFRLFPEAQAALVAAAGSRCPLLVRGEPGAGKSTLAQAAACLLKAQLIRTVVQPHTKVQELLWDIDHTERLASAQLLGRSDGISIDDIRAIDRYVRPGPLWWAFDYLALQNRCQANEHDGQVNQGLFKPEPVPKGHCVENGIVVLIDEIDKADIALSNGLLEVLGSRGFSVPVSGESVPCDTATALQPLVIITSNDTRELPAAFVRRCVVLDIKLPSGAALIDHLCALGQVQFSDLQPDVLQRAAELIVADRGRPGAAHAGQAEYLDLLSALSAISSDLETQMNWLDRLFGYFQKADSGVPR